MQCRAAARYQTIQTEKGPIHKSPLTLPIHNEKNYKRWKKEKKNIVSGVCCGIDWWYLYVYGAPFRGNQTECRWWSAHGNPFDRCGALHCPLRSARALILSICKLLYPFTTMNHDVINVLPNGTRVPARIGMGWHCSFMIRCHTHTN